MRCGRMVSVEMAASDGELIEAGPVGEGLVRKV